jgi:hypothetical protein|tara:strand:+ start:345 stop:542 length:198 start_codon:yes stop_codon:yes gene_type:complete
MKYIIINKWQYKDSKPQYTLKEVCENLEIANKKLKAYELLNNKEENIFYIVPFNEDTLLLTEEVA